VAGPRSAVLFLGSGATAGSGIKKEGESLPTDSGFFESALVTKRLSSGAYPALRLLCRRSFLQNASLHETWNGLLIYRSFVESDVSMPASRDEDELERLTDYPWPSSHKWRGDHYKHQFSIKVKSPNRPSEYYLAELAIWDLRVLVKDVYSGLEDGAYTPLWQRIHNHVRGVVNLNYDTSFDDTLTSALLPACDFAATSEVEKPLLVRPHGSPKWTSTSTYSVGLSCGWSPWESCCTETTLKDMGYRHTGSSNSFLFKQPLIVAPAMLKEEVVGNSSLPGLSNRILRCLYTPKKRVHCSCYDGQHTCRTLREA
jgi:hypothetical protein